VTEFPGAPRGVQHEVHLAAEDLLDDVAGPVAELAHDLGIDAVALSTCAVPRVARMRKPRSTVAFTGKIAARLSRCNADEDRALDRSEP